MLRSYLKTAFRALRRDRGFAVINIGGLAVGMAVCLLMLLFVRQFWLKDHFHDGADRIHRVTTINPDGRRFASSPPPVGPALAQDYAGIEAVTRMQHLPGALLRRGENSFEEDYLYAESSFFRVFDGFRLAQGDASSALAEPYAAVLTPALARKLFGDADPLGQTFAYEGVGDFTVTGVLAERPKSQPTHLGFGVMFSYATLQARERAYTGDWQRLGREYTYLQLADGTRPATVEQHLADLSDRFYPPGSERYHFQLQPLTGIALGSTGLWNTIQSAKMPPFLAYLLLGLGGIALVGAAFNYVNLTVARSLRRGREVGVRKALGARREQVAAQFLAESLLVALAATLGAALLLKGLVPAFKSLYVMRFFDPGLHFSFSEEPSLGLLLLAFGTTVGLVAGAYPAFVLSRPQAADVLSGGHLGSVWKGLWRVNLRKALMGLQLVFALVLTISTVLLYEQARTLRTADHGFRTEQVFSVDLRDIEYATFKAQAQQVVGVAGVTGADNLFMSGSHEFRALTRPSVPGDTLRQVDYYATDSTFAQEMALNVAARLPGAEARYASGAGIILNEKATDALGFASPQAALGQAVIVDDGGPYTVAAVTRDVWFEGFREGEIAPFVLRYEPERIDYALVRVTGGRETRVVADAVGAVWATLGTAYPYAPRPYADLLQLRYGPNEDLSFVTAGVSLVAVLIACLGLAALAAYTAQTRVKEIGVRKTLGASAWDIVRLLGGSFAAVFAVAALVGVPLAWWLAAQLWQPLFARPLAAGPAVFVVCAALLGTLVLGTVGWQALRAARINPTEALRAE